MQATAKHCQNSIDDRPTISGHDDNDRLCERLTPHPWVELVEADALTYAPTGHSTPSAVASHSSTSCGTGVRMPVDSKTPGASYSSSSAQTMDLRPAHCAIATGRTGRPS